jgi:DeoR/GlpR family transcriptional regulator of sugar metabolism
MDIHRNTVTPLGLRDNAHSAQKEIIARRAAALCKNGDTILIDSSSTARRIVKYLSGKQDIKIITNNARIFEECTAAGVELYCTGGYYDADERAFIGAAAERAVKEVYADIFFFSSSAISNDGEISDVSEVETALRRAMLSRARRSVFLCDSSKVGDRRTFVVCNRTEVTDIICDKPLPWE